MIMLGFFSIMMVRGTREQSSLLFSLHLSTQLMSILSTSLLIIYSRTKTVLQQRANHWRYFYVLKMGHAEQSLHSVTQWPTIDWPHDECSQGFTLFHVRGVYSTNAPAASESTDSNIFVQRPLVPVDQLFWASHAVPGLFVLGMTSWLDGSAPLDASACSELTEYWFSSILFCFLWLVLFSS